MGLEGSVHNHQKRVSAKGKLAGGARHALTRDAAVHCASVEAVGHAVLCSNSLNNLLEGLVVDTVDGREARAKAVIVGANLCMRGEVSE